MENETCDQITVQEFDWQSSTHTSKEILSLTRSAEYKEMMARKGKDPSHWNWQVLERSEGHLPKEAADKDVGGIESDEDALERVFLQTDKALNLKEETSQKSSPLKNIQSKGLTSEVMTSAQKFFSKRTPVLGKQLLTPSTSQTTKRSPYNLRNTSGVKQ